MLAAGCVCGAWLAGWLAGWRCWLLRRARRAALAVSWCLNESRLDCLEETSRAEVVRIAYRISKRCSWTGSCQPNTFRASQWWCMRGR